MEGKYRFRLNYLYANQIGRTIEFARFNRNTALYEWLDKKGFLHETAEITDNDQKNILRWVLTSTEPFGQPAQGSGGMTQTPTRCFVEKSYVDAEAEDRIADKTAREANFINRCGHEFLKRHPQVIVRDIKGENINPNAIGNILYELIEVSVLEEATVNKNKKKQEGAQIIRELFEKNEKQFKEFCYAYNVQVKGKTLDQLYNTCMTKLEFDAFGWEKTLKDSNYDLISKINHAIEEGVIEIEGKYYKFNFETIGENLDECVSYFRLNETPMKNLYSKVGFNSEPKVKTPEKPKDSAELGVQQLDAASKQAINKEVYRALMPKNKEVKDEIIAELKKRYDLHTAFIDEVVEKLSK